MARETIATGEMKVEVLIPRFTVHRFADGGGYIEFVMRRRVSFNGMVVSETDSGLVSKNFSELPGTFPVQIGQNLVQVEGQTILDALDSVADAALAAGGNQ